MNNRFIVDEVFTGGWGIRARESVDGTNRFLFECHGQYPRKLLLVCKTTEFRGAFRKSEINFDPKAA